jgi:hypothetical protein
LTLRRCFYVSKLKTKNMPKPIREELKEEAEEVILEQEEVEEEE